MFWKNMKAPRKWVPLVATALAAVGLLVAAQRHAEIMNKLDAIEQKVTHTTN
jgi:hypothetical protein